MTDWPTVGLRPTSSAIPCEPAGLAVCGYSPNISEACVGMAAGCSAPGNSKMAARWQIGALHPDTGNRFAKTASWRSLGSAVECVYSDAANSNLWQPPITWSYQWAIIDIADYHFSSRLICAL